MDDKTWSPLHEAAFLGNIEEVESLLNQGLDVNIVDNYGNSPLHIAVQHGSDKMVQLLVKRGADINQINKNGSAPLHSASRIINPKVAEILVENGADINARNNLGKTPLHLTTSPEITKLLIRSGADVNIADDEGNTPLHLTNRESMERGLLEPGAKTEGETPTDIPSEKKEQFQHGLQTRLDRLTNSLLRTNMIEGPYFEKYQAQVEDLYNDIVKVKVYEPTTVFCYRVVESSSSSEDSDDEDDEGLLPKELIESRRRFLELNELEGTVVMRDPGRRERSFESEPNVASGSETGAIPKRRVPQNVEGEKEESKSMDANTESLPPGIEEKVQVPRWRHLPSSWRVKPDDKLRVACKKGDIQKAMKWLDRGADINATNLKGATLLMIACEGGSKEIASLLVNRGADINGSDNLGNNALHYAARSGRKDIVRLLIKAGIKAGKKNKAGEMASDLASKANHDRLADWLHLHEKLDEIKELFSSNINTTNINITNVIALGNERVTSTSNANHAKDSGSQDFKF